MSPSEQSLETPVGCSGRDVASRPGYAAGGIICRRSSGNKKRGDKDLTAVGAAGWSLRRLNLSGDGERRVGSCARSSRQSAFHSRQTRKHFHFQAARWFRSNTSRTSTNLEKRRQSTSYLRAIRACQTLSSSAFLDYWNHEPQARYHGYMDQVGGVMLLLLWSKWGL